MTYEELKQYMNEYTKVSVVSSAAMEEGKVAYLDVKGNPCPPEKASKIVVDRKLYREVLRKVRAG